MKSLALLSVFIPAGERTGRRTLASLSAVLLLTLVGCSGTDTSRPGDPAVYERIESLTDCDSLQGEFDTAMDNVEAREPGDEFRDISLSYAKAANDRLDEIGCYD